MANFNINMLALPTEPYENDPAIAFFNMFRGKYSDFEDSPQMMMRKINSEVLLKDIIKNNNVIILNSQDINIEDNTQVKPIELATIKNPNELYKVSFIFKESYFESINNTSLNDPFPNDLLQIGNSFNLLQNVDLTGTPTNPIEYDISFLNNLYIKNYTEDNFFSEAIRGYIDIFYNFRKNNGSYDQGLDKWSILRIQFGFGNNESTNSIPYLFNQINIIKESDFNSEIINTGNYPIELYKGTNLNGELIPIYYFGINNISETTQAIEISLREHLPGYTPDGTIFTTGLDNGIHLLNHSNPGISSSLNISSILDNSNIIYNKMDMIKYEGWALIADSSRWKSWNIFGVINDNDYEPLT